MKLSNLMNQKNVMSKEAMSVTFGGYTVNATGCHFTGCCQSDCSDGTFDY